MPIKNTEIMSEKNAKLSLVVPFKITQLWLSLRLYLQESKGTANRSFTKNRKNVLLVNEIGTVEGNR